MKRQIALTAFVCALSAGGAYAQQYDEKYFTVDETTAKIEALDERGGSIAHNGAGVPISQQIPGPVINPPIPGPEVPFPQPGPAINPPPGGSGLGEIIQNINVIDNVVNLAQKMWDIIEKNQPVVNITTNYANAVPYGTTHWSQLQGWSKPATKKYAFSIKNTAGREVVKVAYQVHYTYDGNLRGKGKFLTGVTIEPLNVVTSWGYKVSLVSEVPDSTVANVGTHEDPIASMQVQLKWTVHNAFKDTTAKAIYYVQGDGLLQELAGTPIAKGSQEKSDLQLTDLREQFEKPIFK
jgi:hypothetical protein